MAVPLSSLNGDVHWNGSQVAHSRGWNITPANAVSEFATNLTKGKMNRRPGITDATGDFTIYSTDGSVPALPGQIAVLKLWVDTTNAWTITNAIITTIDEAVDMETGALLGFTVNWAFAGKDDGVGGSIVTPGGTTLDRDAVGEVEEG